MMDAARLAVLIDAENISHNLADRVFELIAPLGRITLRRIYGDFRGQASSWDAAAGRHALEARQCFATAKGKNGADIALAVDAMELFCSRAVDGFCIVSSDSDFTALVRRIREDGRPAYGIGRGGTAEGYRTACTRFFALPAPAVVTVAAREPHAALPAIRKVLAECAPMDTGWFHMGAFGQIAKRQGLTPGSYGVARLGKLIEATGQFTIKGDLFRPASPVRAVAGGTAVSA